MDVVMDAKGRRGWLDKATGRPMPPGFNIARLKQGDTYQRLDERVLTVDSVEQDPFTGGFTVVAHGTSPVKVAP